MSVFRALDKMEHTIKRSFRIPLLNLVFVEAETLLNLLEKMRSSLPEEMKQARWVSKENQRILQEAQEKANEILKEAREKANQLATDSEIVHLAREKAAEITREARETARLVRIGADDYAKEVLSGIENELGRILSIIQRSREKLCESATPSGGEEDRDTDKKLLISVTS
ncbi:MAG: ATPase [Armatimonadetes bacterium]|nr:ATPase [Armatimonadota bacterium]